MLSNVDAGAPSALACREHADRFGLVVGLDLQYAFEIRDERTLSRPYVDLLDEARDRLSVWTP